MLPDELISMTCSRLVFMRSASCCMHLYLIHRKRIQEPVHLASRTSVQLDCMNRRNC